MAQGMIISSRFTWNLHLSSTQEAVQ